MSWLGNMVFAAIRRAGYDLVRVRYNARGQRLVLKPIDPLGVELLADAAFQASCEEVYSLTLLDTPRLANLWQLSRLTDPAGQLIEVGAYRGGSALHLSNACPDRHLFVCDSFTGFRQLHPKLDRVFDAAMFKDTSREAVEALFRRRQRRATVVAGFFPESCAGLELRPLSFAHLDVDTYEATRAALAFLADKMLPRSLIVLDDYHRTADGVDAALAEFTTTHPDWTLLPLFPSQALLMPKTWFDGAAAPRPAP